MKYLITILICLLTVASFSQRTPRPTGNPTLHNELWNRYNGYVSIDSGAMYRARDTNWTPINSYKAIIVRATDSLPYWWNGAKWQRVAAPSTDFVKYSDSTIVFVTPTQFYADSNTIYVTPTQLGDSLENYVTIGTVQTVIAKKTWDSSQTFLDSIGVGAAPTSIFDVRQGTSRLGFDGTRLSLYDDVSDLNILIGSTSGGVNLVDNNIGIGTLSLRNVTGADNVVMGFGNLSSSGTANRNTAIGSRALQLSNSSDNATLGYFAGVANFGDSSIAIGSNAQAAKVINTSAINNSEIVIGTNTYSGATTASFISSNSLVVGTRYTVLITFNGTIPTPFTSASMYANATPTSASTIQLNTSIFTSQGTSTTTFRLYNKQVNSISIGAYAATDSSNQISIGNTNSTLFKSNKFAVNINSTPANGDVYIYNSSTGKLEPASVSAVPQRVKNMTTTQRDALTPTAGMIIFNTTDTVGQMYDGSGWQDLF